MNITAENRSEQQNTDIRKKAPVNGLQGPFRERGSGLPTEAFLPSGSAADVVVCREKVHCLEKLVRVNEGADDDQTAENAPQPEGACVEVVGDAAAAQLVSDAAAELVRPDDGINAQRQPREDEENQTVVHGLSSVIPAGDEIDVRTDVGHHHETVNAERKEIEQDQLQKAAVRLELTDRSCARGCAPYGLPP